MTTTQIDETEAFAHAEELVAQVEAEAVRFARSLLAHALEIVEDVWAEAESARESRLER